MMLQDVVVVVNLFLPSLAQIMLPTGSTSIVRARRVV